MRCLYGKADTTISCVFTCIVGSAQTSGCVLYGPRLWLQYYCTCNYCKNTTESHIQICPIENDLVLKDLTEENCKIAYIDDSDDDLEIPQNRGNGQGLGATKS